MAKCRTALLCLVLELFVSSGQSQGGICDGNLTSPACSENVSCGQSSIYSGSWGSSVDGRIGTSLDCHAAIDGDTSKRWASVNGTDPPNCVSTALQQHPYWWVDLGHTVNIHNITMYIEYFGRLDNAIVNLDGQLIFTFTPPSARQNPYIINSALPRAGRNISVQYPQNYSGASIVVLCEVQVWGCPVNKHGGPDCEHDCSVHCNDNGGQTKCDSISGNCTNGCNAGRWGGQCERACPQQCSPGQCDRNSGCLQCDGHFTAPSCTDCQSGWWGGQCDQQCPQQCSGQCDRNSGCTQCNNHYDAPNCTDCQAGWWGRHCDLACPVQCSTPGDCNRYNGCTQCNNHYTGPNCTDCQGGWWGGQCDRACPQQCSPTGCDRNSGCTQCNKHFAIPNCADCQSLWWGANCNQQCHPTRCSDCNRQTGCIQCAGHFAVPSCTECTVGLWGASNCSLNCSLHCAGNGACHIADGTCTRGCWDEWSGPECPLKPTSGSSESLVGPLVGAVLGGCLLLALSVVVAALLIRSRRTRATSRNGVSSHISISTVQESGLNTFQVEGSPRPASTKDTAVKENPYEEVENYENTRDEAKPSNKLQPDQSNIQSQENPYDQLAAQYHDTGDVKPYEALLLTAREELATSKERHIEKSEGKASLSGAKILYANTRFKRPK